MVSDAGMIKALTVEMEGGKQPCFSLIEFLLHKI
jgi:hypothetical protein